MKTRFSLWLFFLFGFVVGSAWANSGKIALIQYNADLNFGDYLYNREQLTAFTEEAVMNAANLVVFPEGSLYGYADAKQRANWCSRPIGSFCRDVAAVAETIPEGVSTRYWSQIAQLNGITIVFNLPEAASGRYFNTSVVVGPNGYIGKYQKRSLYYIDEYYASPGSQAMLLDLPFGKFGMLICADTNDRKYYDEYKSLGADAILIQMDWDETGGADFFMKQARKRAMNIYASDVSVWDSTGYYSPENSKRERYGLPDTAIGIDGISYHHTD